MTQRVGLLSVSVSGVCILLYRPNELYHERGRGSRYLAVDLPLRWHQSQRLCSWQFTVPFVVTWLLSAIRF